MSHAPGLLGRRTGSGAAVLGLAVVFGGALLAEERFECLGVPVTKAMLMATAVGPDATGERDLLYFDFAQTGATLFLVVVDLRAEKPRSNHRHLVTNQSIVSLAYDPRSGLVYGGSSVAGGGGTASSEPEARFFAFDPTRKQKVFETSLAPGTTGYPAITSSVSCAGL